ncbi:MAG TPA: MarR family transcriptional regulator [Bacteroidales bacterium]|mgnify:CR=1 FL=1|nr:MarR family transcriptional regulator [Bacteroidales bacterium]
MEKIISIISKISHTLGEMEELAKEHYNLQELTLTQMHYLEVMSTLTNPNITELASELQLTKPTVTVALDKLIEKEYVIKVQSDADRRTSHLHLTEKGRGINNMHEYAHRRFAELMNENLEPEEMQQLIILLEKMTNKL